MLYHGQQSHRLTVAGLTRDLPIVRVAPDLWIASFVMLGDTELVNACSKALAARLVTQDFDLLAGPEAKALPLLHSVATLLGHPRYVVCRKSIKAYMQCPTAVGAESITTHGKQTLVLDGVDVERIRGKRVAVLDDVVSTGGSLTAVEELLVKAGAKVACRASVLREGDSYKGDLIYLEDLPVFRGTELKE